VRWPGESRQNLQKMSNQVGMNTSYYLSFTIVRHVQTIKGLQLVVEREDRDGKRGMQLEVSLRMIAHHGVEEFFGRFQDGTEVIDFLSLRHQFNEKSRRMWDGIRLFCANILLWNEERIVPMVEDLDRDEWVKEYLRTIVRMASGRRFHS
jgi:predicted DNA-binding protein